MKSIMAIYAQGQVIKWIINVSNITLHKSWMNSYCSCTPCHHINVQSKMCYTLVTFYSLDLWTNVWNHHIHNSAKPAVASKEINWTSHPSQYVHIIYILYIYVCTIHSKMSMLVCVFRSMGKRRGGWIRRIQHNTQGFKMPSKFFATFIQHTYCTSMYIINV